MAEDEHECDLCFEEFDRDTHEPRKLPCCHTYCSQCLERLLTGTTITCPNDRTVHTLGDFGVFGLPVDTSQLSAIDDREAMYPAYVKLNRDRNIPKVSQTTSEYPQMSQKHEVDAITQCLNQLEISDMHEIPYSHWNQPPNNLTQQSHNPKDTSFIHLIPAELKIFNPLRNFKLGTRCCCSCRKRKCMRSKRRK